MSAFKRRGVQIIMLGSETEDALFLLISIFSLIASVINFILLFFFLRIREKQRIHRLFLLQNASLLAFSSGLLGFINSIEIFKQSQVEWSHQILAMGFLNVCCVGFVSASIDWFHVAACYAGKEELARGKNRNLAHVPIGLVIVALWALFLIDRSSGLEPVYAAYHFTAILSTLLGGLFVLFASKFYMQTALKSRRKNAIGMTIISIIPIIGCLLSLSSMLLNLEYGSSLIIVVQIITFLIANALLALGLFRTGHLKLLTAAIQKIFYNSNDIVLVLDRHAKITYFNSLTNGIFPNIHAGIGINELGYQLGTKLDQFRRDASISTNFELNIKGLIYRVRILPVESEEQIIGWIITLTDITKRKQVEEKLTYNALHDQLTDLPNRVLFLDRLNHALLSAQRDENYKYAVLSMDLDRFKFINDNLGRQAGDQVIIEVGNRLKKCLRKVDTIARLEGDEFVILLEKISGVRAATEVAIRTLELLSQPMRINEQDIFLSISIGIAMGSPHHKEPDDVLREADIAQHQAKERGKSQYVIFDKEMHTHVSTLFDIETSLNKAIHKDEFILHYQPILSLPNQEIIGFETLLRWSHPKHGVMLPAEFLPEAEGSDLIIPIGHWGIQRACKDLTEWTSKFPTDPPFMISINLSQRQIIDPDLIDHTISILETTGMNPSCLVFEIKEKMIMENDPEILDALLRLKSIGVRLAIDQFGTGYSTLRILPSLPLDIIKIDRSFIRNIQRSMADYEIVRFMIELGDRLGLDVIAEGVESPHESVELQSIHCKHAQGDYFHKPLPKEAILPLLKDLKRKKAGSTKIDYRKLMRSIKQDPVEEDLDPPQ